MLSLLFSELIWRAKLLPRAAKPLSPELWLLSRLGRQNLLSAELMGGLARSYQAVTSRVMVVELVLDGKPVNSRVDWWASSELPNGYLQSYGC